MISPAWYLLIYVVLPGWLFAGFADYLCHRVQRIEHANGMKESALHWLMLAEVGAPLLAAVFLKINALLIGVMIFCWIAHEITTHFDLRLATRTREVPAYEQQVHSFLEVLPVAALLLICVLHWPQALALFGLGSERAELSLHVAPLPAMWQLIVLFGGLTVFGLVPYAEEMARGFLAAKASASATR